MKFLNRHEHTASATGLDDDGDDDDGGLGHPTVVGSGLTQVYRRQAPSTGAGHTPLSHEG